MIRMPVDWNQIDKKWQSEWAKEKIFESDPDRARKKCFVTFPFAYMSGPLHVGSGFTAARIDVYARYMRMRGYNVLYPWAWHWTGKTVAGAAERIKMGDESFIRPIREVDEVPEEELKKFVDPVYMAQYYTDVNREAIKRLGMAIDWRREFHTSSLNEAFSKFVTWQYLRLRERGYVTRGTHPVVWCPKDESPTGDADRLEGAGVRPEEFILMKFKTGDGAFLPCATFRPETIYGVTNLWINPQGDYVEADVNGERWIISRTASQKLQNQMKQVRAMRDLKGAELVGKKCTDPVLNRELLILPGTFVNTENASGLVYSVPAHAPLDWLALRDVQRNPSIVEKFNVKASDVQAIEPISIISVEGYGEFPAVEIADRMGLRDQNDPRAEEATKEIYKAEYHGGILKDECGPYSKKKVAEVKTGLVRDFRAKGIADVIYELPEKVVCRCTTECVAKLIDQWFLKYSDPDWKELAHKATSKMAFYPEEARNWFDGIIDWFLDWPCARKTGLGTPLPWSPDWIVETLSDSTIYMAYYAVSKFVNEGSIKAEHLAPEVFDFIFYGTGNPQQLTQRTKIDLRVLNKVREDFLYWYPVDLRNSGKDLVGNHLTFFIFHHVALFEERFWPRGIGVNGFMLLEGKEIHKSKGNFIPLWKACEDYGADAVRCGILLAAEGMDDPDWRSESVRDVKARLESFLRLVEEVSSYKERASNGYLEKWLMSRIYAKTKLVSEAIEKLKTRTALAAAIYDVWNDLRWYQRRAVKPDSTVMKAYLSAWTRLLTPFAPHLAEEAWQILSERKFVSNAEWPKFAESEIDDQLDDMEELIKETLEDTKEIIATTKITPKKVHYYTAAKWKWRVYTEALKRAETAPETLDGLIRDMIAAKTGTPKDLPTYAVRIIKQVRTMSPDLRARRAKTGEVNESNAFSEAREFLAREMRTEIEVHGEEDHNLYDPKVRAKMAEPYRPAIFVE